MYMVLLLTECISLIPAMNKGDLHTDRCSWCWIPAVAGAVELNDRYSEWDMARAHLCGWCKQPCDLQLMTECTAEPCVSGFWLSVLCMIGGLQSLLEEGASYCGGLPW